jgi:hypothetical protein
MGLNYPGNRTVVPLQAILTEWTSGFGPLLSGSSAPDELGTCSKLCYVSLLLSACCRCACVQDKRAALNKFGSTMMSPAAAKSLTVPQLVTLTACLELEDQHAAHQYCLGLWSAVFYGDASCADVIVSAGCVPHLIDCLRRWSTVGPWGVVYYACWALDLLAEKGSTSARTAINSVSGIQATLQAAKESALDGGYAATALEKLSL